MPASSPKPYRVYRQPRRVRGDGSIQWDSNAAGHGAAPAWQAGTGAPPKRRFGSGSRPGRGVLRVLRRIVFAAIVIAVVWVAVAFLAFRSAVKEANERVPPAAQAALAPSDGPAMVSAHTILLVGADSSKARRGDGGRADSMILLRIDVPSRSWSMLSIPRDLLVEIPGEGTDKVNAAYAIGGLALSIKTVENLTGIDVNHVVQIDFDGFKEVVDAVGGVQVYNPKRLQSSEPFDGYSWTFPKGRQTLNGKRALAYARLRKTTDPRESDVTRALRQQAVIDAILRKVLSTDSLLHPRKVPHAVVSPLTTDISASQMLAFGFGKWWSKPENTMRCRLGGDLGDKSQSNGTFVSGIVPNAENRATVRMWAGKQPPVMPDLLENQFAPGCIPAKKR